MVVYRRQMVSGIHREDEDGIVYWMAKGGRGRERVNWVMKLGISDVSSKLHYCGRESAESDLHLSATVGWTFLYHQRQAEVI
jgi:hypothetical protein